jgi:hypothetical protein
MPSNVQVALTKNRAEMFGGIGSGHVKELQKERIATLKAVADLITDQYKFSAASVEEVYEARLQVVLAELDAAEKESDRITFYQSVVDVTKEYEKVADQLAKTAKAPGFFVLKVKARRPEAEINLQRTKAVVAKEKM